MSRGVSDKITFKPYNQNEQWLLPPSLDKLVPENHFVRIVHAESMPELKETMRLHHHTILVCWRITEDLIPLLRIVDGVVSESGSDISAEVLADVNKQLVWITNVTDAQKNF